MENLFASRSLLSKSLQGQIWSQLQGPLEVAIWGLMPGDPLRIWDTQGPPRFLEGQFWSPFRAPLLAQLNEDLADDG